MLKFSKMTRRTMLAGGAAVFVAGGLWQTKQSRSRTAALQFFETSVKPPKGPLRTYHLGHSLVGREMPAMLAQLAGSDHEYHSQLGWGTPLQAHWEEDIKINGFDHENAHSLFRPAKAAIGSGNYDAVVLTEMVEIKDSIRYHASSDYLAKWATLARAANPDARVYMYETWHHLDDGNGWLWRVDNDLEKFWERKVVLPAINQIQAPIHIIPAGQVMAAVIRAVEAEGGVGNLQDRTTLFSRSAAGDVDSIHLSDIGLYLVALAHYATLYHRSPEGLPFELARADGTPAKAPDAVAAAMMQKTAWEIVKGYDKSGVRA